MSRVETELNIYLSEVTEEGLELSGTLDDSIYGFEDEFLKPFAGLRYELGVLHVGSELLVRGRIEQDFEAVCSRCGEDFDFTVKIPDFAASFEINEKTEFVELTTEVRECI